MNAKSFFVAAIFLLLSVSITASSNKLTPETKDKAEQNYLTGLTSDNEGLRVSSAYFLGEINSSKAVIPLMRMLREDDSEAVRMVAALSLVKIQDARGIYLVKKSIEFNDYETVRNRCERFYAAYLHEKNTDKINEDADLIAGIFK